MITGLVMKIGFMFVLCFALKYQWLHFKICLRSAGRCALYWHNNNLSCFPPYQVRFCLAHLSSFALNFQTLAGHTIISPTISQSQRETLTDRDTESNREKKRGGREPWHRISHLPMVMYRQNILKPFSPSTISAAVSWYAVAIDCLNSFPQIMLTSGSQVAHRVLISELQHVSNHMLNESMNSVFPLF